MPIVAECSILHVCRSPRYTSETESFKWLIDIYLGTVSVKDIRKCQKLIAKYVLQT